MFGLLLHQGDQGFHPCLFVSLFVSRITKNLFSNKFGGGIGPGPGMNTFHFGVDAD